MVSRSPVRLSRQFEIANPPLITQKRSLVEDSTFASAMAPQPSPGKSRQSRRLRSIAPVSQGVLP